MKIKTMTLLSLSLTTAAYAAPCMDYYTPGPSNCDSPEATPIKPKPPATPQAAGSKPADPVDTFLENYGKPPREFVEFYLNPTAENAVKWVSTYQGMLQRSQQLGRAWSQADVLYKQALANGQIQESAAPSNLPKVPDYGIPVASDILSQGLVTNTQQNQQSDSPSLGNQPTEAINIGVQEPGESYTQSQIQLTYYFSAACPFCARMTPQLSQLAQKMGSKLILTCVDVTPYSASTQPQPDNIRNKLSCNWRLPEDGEVEREGVKQTPTLVIHRGKNPPARISGYVPPEQLQSYLEANTGPAEAPRL